MGLYFQHEADQLLVFAIAEDDGYERNIQDALLTNHTDMTVNLRQSCRTISAECLIASHIALAHRYELGIDNADLINGIGIVRSQRLLIVEAGQ